MEASPAKFLFGFLFVSIILWIIFMFASRLLASILSRVMGASVGFRFGGWKCLRDVVLKFNKGAIESISIGEIRLSLRQSLIKLGVGFISRDPKLKVVICDLEIVLRSSKKSAQKTRSKKSRSSGRGKWMIANMARFLSIYVTDLVLKTRNATLDFKELRIDISKDGESEAGLFVKLQIFPIYVHLGDSRMTSDQSVTSGGFLSANQLSDGVCSPFSCEEFCLLCELGHNREAGIVVRNLDITSGEVRVNLSEDLLLKENGSSYAPPKPAPGVVPANKESASAKELQGKQALSAVFKYTSRFPEKVDLV